jgi:hypothetical protein
MELVRADSAWANGFKGEGVVIANMDSGVDKDHPAFTGITFKGRDFTGENNPWLDGIGHGTHTTGTICGGDGNFGITDIGVAPSIDMLIMAKIFDSQGYSGNISAAFQWIADLKADSGINIRAVNNSWGSCNTTNTYYWNAIQTWRALEIFPVFAIGNNANCGTSCYSTGTAGTPGNFPIVIGVGTVDVTECHDCVGQRGPAPNQNPWNDPQYWFYPSWNLLKPDIAAPGSNVRSSVPGGGYQNWDGSSMAAPHITGALALLFQANPSLSVDSAYMILVNTAYQPNGCGYTYPNDRVGWGILDVWSAIKTQLGNPILNLSSVDTSEAGGTWDPGEYITFDITLENVGQETAYNVTGKLRTTNSYITVVDSEGTWPDIAPGSSELNTDNFRAYADPSTPIGTNVTFTLEVTFYNSQNDMFQTTFNFTYTVGALGATIFDIPAGNAILSVSNTGAIPSADEGGNVGLGTGFKWPINGQNHLYYGSVGLGNSSNYMVDEWYNGANPDGFDNDFDARAGLWWASPPPKGDTFAESGYDDFTHPSPKGIYVKQEAFAFEETGNPGCGNGVIIRLKVKNNGSSDVQGLYSGIFADFDIGGANYDQNRGDQDLSRELIYMFYSSTYVGITVIEPSGSFIGKFINNPTYVWPDGKPTESEKFGFLSGTLGDDQASNPDDWSLCASYGPFDLAVSESLTVVFAIVGGNSLSNLQENVDNIKNCYTSIKETLKPISWEKLKLNIKTIGFAHNKLSILYTIPYKTDYSIKLIDETGRTITVLDKGTKDKGIYKLTTNNLKLNKGKYFLKLITKDKSSVTKLINIE